MDSNPRPNRNRHFQALDDSPDAFITWSQSMDHPVKCSSEDNDAQPQDPDRYIANRTIVQQDAPGEKQAQKTKIEGKIPLSDGDAHLRHCKQGGYHPNNRNSQKRGGLAAQCESQ